MFIGSEAETKLSHVLRGLSHFLCTQGLFSIKVFAFIAILLALREGGKSIPITLYHGERCFLVKNANTNFQKSIPNALSNVLLLKWLLGTNCIVFVFNFCPHLNAHFLTV